MTARKGNAVQSTSVLLTGAMLLGALQACAPVALHSNLTDAELRVKLDTEFEHGMTRPAVEHTLDELKVSSSMRTWYDEPPAPPQLLVRLFPPGGAWLDDEDDTLRWVDVVYVFTSAEPSVLDRIETFRGSQRYWHGDPVNIPATPTKYPWRRYPAMPPPPAAPIVREQR